MENKKAPEGATVQNECKGTENPANILTVNEINQEICQMVREPEQKVGLYRVQTANQCLTDAKLQPVPETSLSVVHSSEDILQALLDGIESLNFQEVVHPEVADLKKRLSENTDDSEKEKIQARIKQCKVTDRQKYVVIVEELLRLAVKRQWGICKNQTFVYLFNGAFWTELDKEVMQKFLGDAAERMGMPKYDARQFTIKDNLYKQFLATGFEAMPENSDRILVNLLNGTFEVDRDGNGVLRPANKADFLKYQLPFEYNPKAACPQFQSYMDTSLPDKSLQGLLAEFIGCVFAKNLKLEKALILYGNGANGKSVFFDVICALLGHQNVSSYSVDALCEPQGYYRAKIANKLLNYSSEIGRNFSVDKFKQLCSGEPVEARLPYGEPFEIRNYSRLIFNANHLPRDVEQSDAFFRRFLIVPFTVSIPPERQDINLARRIIESELSGVFNWALHGLERINRQKRFSDCEAARQVLQQYQQESDSVWAFLEESNYIQTVEQTILLKDLYDEYKKFCGSAGYIACGSPTFKTRLENKNFKIRRISKGREVYIKKGDSDVPF